MRIGINGFGRMGRLALRAGWEHPDLAWAAVNDPGAEAATMALLLEHDSIHGRWTRACAADGDALAIGDARVPFSREPEPGAIDWAAHGVDLVLECSGRFRTRAQVDAHRADRVLVSAPLKDGDVDIVMGVNDDAFDLARERVVTAASCTTNCLAPVVKVLLDAVGIERGTVTTIHDPTNTQVVVDAPHRDPRRARSAQLNLIPTSSNSSYAVTRIFPQLEGRLESLAVRVPVFGASITDAVFHVPRDTTIDEVNAAFRAAAAAPPLQGILGYEERPLVSSDFRTDPRSAVVDAGSTRVTDRHLVKVLAWYDNEWGYANRMVELAAAIARASS